MHLRRPLYLGQSSVLKFPSSAARFGAAAEVERAPAFCKDLQLEDCEFAFDTGCSVDSARKDLQLEDDDCKDSEFVLPVDSARWVGWDSHCTVDMDYVSTEGRGGAVVAGIAIANGPGPLRIHMPSCGGLGKYSASHQRLRCSYSVETRDYLGKCQRFAGVQSHRLAGSVAGEHSHRLAGSGT